MLNKKIIFAVESVKYFAFTIFIYICHTCKITQLKKAYLTKKKTVCNYIKCNFKRFRKL